MALSLVSINIETDRHFARFLPLLTERAPDVVCFQELMKRDIPRITEALGGALQYHPVLKYEEDSEDALWGIGIWSRFPIRSANAIRYAGNAEGPGIFREEATLEEKYAAHQDTLLYADIEKEGETYRIATTHFPWTMGGQPNAYQLAAADSLVSVLAGVGEYVLCGDFNAPRGGETFAKFSAILKDNIPAKYETSLDKDLHKAGYLPYMVDVLFTTPSYAASDVSLQFGVSDHAAIVATITKNAA